MKKEMIFSLLLVLSLGAMSITVGKDFSFGGNASIGVSLMHTQNSEGSYVYDQYRRIGVLQLKAKYDIMEEWDLKCKVEYDNSFHTMKLQKLFARYQRNENDLRLGYMKKQFTLEESHHFSKRLFDKRSLVNEYLSSYHLLSKDLSVQYKYSSNTERKEGDLYSAVSIDGAGRVLFVVNGTVEGKRGEFSMAVLYNYAESVSEYSSLFGTIGGRLFTAPFQHELEVTIGQSLEMRMIAEQTGDSCNILFGGARLQQKLSILVQERKLHSTNFFWEVAAGNDDLNSHSFTGQLRPGFSLHFGEDEQFRWRTSSDIRVSWNGTSENSLSPYQFDILTEVVLLW